MLSKIFFIMKNVFVSKCCAFGKNVGTLLWWALSGVLLLLLSAVIFCGFVTTALIATPIAIVEALFMFAWAYVFPVSAAKCWSRWQKRRGCKDMEDAILFYFNNYNHEWHYPVAKETFMFLTSWVKSAKFRFNPYFVEETEPYIWPAENQIRWYEDLHTGDKNALCKLSSDAFMKMWNNHNAEYNLKQFILMKSKLPEEAMFDILGNILLQYEKVNWQLVYDWFMSQCRSAKAVHELIIVAMMYGKAHLAAEIAETIVLKNGLSQSVIAALFAQKDREVARCLIAANTNYEYIVMLKSANCNLTALLKSSKKLNPEFDGFDSVVEMYLNEATYKIYHNCGYSLKVETVRKMLSSDNMSLSFLKEIADNEPMFKDLASLDEEIKILLKSKMKYMSKLI